MIQIATTIEQSRKLVELGLSADTADMFWLVVKDARLHVKTEDLSHYKNWENYPAWSLSKLLELMPSSTLDMSNDHWGRIRCMEKFTNWCINPIDAAFEMVAYLLENKLI